MHQKCFALVCLIFAASESATAQSLPQDYVAQVTMQDVQGYYKTRLFKTTEKKCQRHLSLIVQQSQDTIGIARVVSAKCGRLDIFADFFAGRPMDVPFILSGLREVLIIPDASPEACQGLAMQIRTAGQKGICILPE